MKRMAALFIPLSLFSAETPSADRLFEATLYEEAIPIYEKELGENGSHRYRLALSYFQTGRFRKAAELLTESSDLKERYLLALSRIELSEYSLAEETLKELLKAPSPDDPNLSFDVLFELGRTYFLWNKKAAAKEIFSRFTEDPRYGFKSALYLTRMDLSEGRFDEASARLSDLRPAADQADAEKYELHYYLGMIAFHREEFQNAADLLRQSLPERHPENTSWFAQAQYHLGLSYMRLEDFDRGIEVMEKLLKHAEEERYVLALGQIYAAKAKRGDREAAGQIESLLTSHPALSSRDAAMQALFLRAEAAPEYTTRKILYRQLTHESNQNSPYFGKAWYLRALNDLQNSQYNEAAEAFSRAYDHLIEKNGYLAALSLKYQAEAYQLFGSYEKALDALDRLKKDAATLQNLPEPDEVDYLYALIASQGENFQVAKETIAQSLRHSPNGPFADDNLYLLASIHHKEKEDAAAHAAFLRIATEFPDSPLAAEALFWAAKYADSPVRSRELLRKSFEEYPKAAIAPEAYFTYYQYREYLQGDRSAIRHLQQLRKRYPDSHYNLNADYLIGLDFKRNRKTEDGKWIRKQSLTDAIDAFRRVELAFNDLYEKNQIPDQDYYTRVRYRAMLERAAACLEVANQSRDAKQKIYLEYAEETLRQVLEDFADPQHPLTAAIQKDELYPLLQQESYFLLAKTFVAAGKNRKAKETLAQMIAKYQEEKISRGYFLSRAWYELGSIAIAGNDHALALSRLNNAEDAAKGKVLSSDEKLDLWITQSLCLQEMGKFNEAMLTLSNVINSDAISSLRVKAMFLRAEIYEKQGRKELAKNQLEATSRKGGEWAKKAKLKMEETYGYP